MHVRLAAVLAVLAAAIVPAAGVSAARAAGPSLDALLPICDQAGSLDAQRVCIQRKVLVFLEARRDPADDMPKVDAYAHQVGGVLGTECHILMHWVGRRYGQDEHVTLADLQHLLPHSNDPGCSAGFSHGLIISLGPQIEKMGPAGAAASCAAAKTRYERYSCVHGLGHAYMRLFDDTLDPGLAACRALGPRYAVDCAQGAYHDYWLAVSGADSARNRPDMTTSPRRLCGTQPREFVRACWYRAWLEAPDTRFIDSAKGILQACAGLTRLQRAGCVTGASLVAQADPFLQMGFCRSLSAVDAVDCVRGVRVQALVGQDARQLALARGCSTFPAAAREGCTAWLGKTLAVVTNGAFARSCAMLGPFAAACRRGAASMNGPLETFS